MPRSYNHLRHAGERLARTLHNAHNITRHIRYSRNRRFFCTAVAYALLPHNHYAEGVLSNIVALQIYIKVIDIVSVIKLGNNHF